MDATTVSTNEVGRYVVLQQMLDKAKLATQEKRWDDAIFFLKLTRRLENDAIHGAMDAKSRRHA